MKGIVEMKNTISKRLVALCMAFAMMFSLMTVVHADTTVNDGLSAPTTHSAATMPAEVSSILVGSTTAYYETDDNTGNTTYIRAQLTGKTEYDLKNAAVTVNLQDSSTTVKLDGTAIDGGTARTFTTNLMNKAHTLTIGSTDYVLAAGLPSGQVSVSSADPLSMGTVKFDGRTMTVYGANVQNPFMGNTYFVNRNTSWTFINYFVTGILPSSSTLGEVEATYTLKDGATLAGAGAEEVTSTDCVFNFTAGNIITVTNNSESRSYDAELAISGQSVIVKEEGGVRNYDINLTEVIRSSYYADAGIKAKVDDIVTAWNAYIAVPHTFAAGTNVMAILQAFDTWATQTVNPVTNVAYFTNASDFGGGSYLSRLNNLNWNDCGSMGGYMYTNDANGLYNANVEGLNTAPGKSSIPMVAANNMTFTDSTRIVWFFTVNYSNWF